MPLPYDCELTSKITRSLDREQNELLYARVMAGEDKAREEMIEGNMPLVINKVDAFIGCYPQAAHLRDDLHSAGFMALVQAVNTMVEHDRPRKKNPTGYLSVAITHEIAKVAEREADMGLTNIPSDEEFEETRGKSADRLPRYSRVFRRFQTEFFAAGGRTARHDRRLLRVGR